MDFDRTARPRTAISVVTQPLEKTDIEWVHVRHKEVAAFAAGAEAHLTGELAVCAGSCGPGNLHLINGSFDCHRSRVSGAGHRRAHSAAYIKRVEEPGDIRHGEEALGQELER